MAMKLDLKKYYYLKLSANLLVASELETHTPLSQMPPFSGKLTAGKSTKKYMFQLWGQGVARQYRYQQGSDYVAPPKGYILWGCDLSTEFKIKQQPFRFNLSINNLLNSKYRSYLNRFRYFADEPGFGLTARLIMPLNIALQKNKFIKKK